ncbi:MAG: hypothetical protein UZ22_OP11002001107 [Microgenomates bacterium OLB23]|nr:MAG: hypothetical protein UZ22_OP11002001107 [Microgenomates bacterium OLB23]
MKQAQVKEIVVQEGPTRMGVRYVIEVAGGYLNQDGSITSEKGVADKFMHRATAQGVAEAHWYTVTN